MSGSQSQPGGSQPEPGADPSMEDILASIRRILSEEDAPVDPGVAAEPGAPPDVLVLDRSMLVPDAPHPGEPSMPPAGLSPPGHHMELSPAHEEPETFGESLNARVEPAVVRHPIPEEAPPAPAIDAESFASWDQPVIEAEPPEVAPPHPVEPLITPNHTTTQSEGSIMNDSPPPSSGLASDETAAAAAGSVTNLVRALASDRGAQVHSGGPTVTDLVREELRPMLKAWLDSNLPPMVERMVRAEIERVISRAAV